jgi:RNA polymerase sigma factor (sigma-70 family)
MTMLEHDLLAFATDAGACPGADALRAHVLHILQEAAPSESAIFVPLSQYGIARPPVARNKSPAGTARHRLYAADPVRYAEWALRSRAITTAQRGAYRDSEAFPQTYRDKCLFYGEIVRPQGITKQIVAAVTFRGARTGSIHLERYGRDPDFSELELEAVRGLLPAVAVAQAALDPPTQDLASEANARLRSRLCGLSVRERQLVEYVMRGLSNRDIATVCGTSPNTVRNQISRIFDKLGASSRAELASWAMSVADRGEDFVLFTEAPGQPLG